MSSSFCGKNQKPLRCLKQDELYFNMVQPLNRHKNVTEFNNEIIQFVDFQNNPYLGITSDDQLKKLKHDTRCVRYGRCNDVTCDCHKKDHYGRRHPSHDYYHHNRIRNNLWYHNNSADLGRDSLYQNQYIAARNPYYDFRATGAGMPYFTSKYLR